MDMKITDIIKLVQACGKNGVRECELGELKLRFGDKPEPVITLKSQTIEIPEKYKELSPEEEEEAQALLQSQLEHDELETLRLQDPYEYEKRIFEGMSNGE